MSLLTTMHLRAHRRYYVLEKPLVSCCILNTCLETSNYTIQLHSAKHLMYRYIFTLITQLLREYICCWWNLGFGQTLSLQKFKLVICIFHQFHFYMYMMFETETHHPIDFDNQSCRTL